MLVALYPMIYVLLASFSDPAKLLTHAGPIVKPLEPVTLAGYKRTFSNPNIYTGYRNTLMYLALGVPISMLLTAMGAFVPTRRHFLIRSVMMKAIMITMFLNGGMIPTFFVVKKLGLYDSMWALILPSCMSTYNLIILRTFFSAIPSSLEESAIIDGANDWQVFSRLVIPLSKPALAVICLYYAVGMWNSWFPAMIYIRNRDLYPLQMFLREIIILNEEGAETNMEMEQLDLSSELVKYCTIIISMVPILCVYPFLQKYFVKGVMIGAVKE